MLTLYNKFTPVPCPAASVLLFIARRNILLDELPKYSANLQNKSKASGQIAGQIRGILTADWINVLCPYVKREPVGDVMLFTNMLLFVVLSAPVQCLLI
jgi:hypothetical protein